MRITKCLAFFLVSAITLAVHPGTAQDPMLEYMLYKEPRPLTLDTLSIAAISAPGAVVARGVEEFPSEPLTDELSLVDISASPSSGDPGQVVALIDFLVADPTNTAFITAVIVADTDISMILGPTIHVAFEADVPLSAVELELQAVGAGEILEIDWRGKKNLFRVDGNSLSGLEVLERANALAQMPDVLYANPNVFYTGDLVDVVVHPLPSLLTLRPVERSVSRLLAAFPVSKEAPLCAPLGPGPFDPFFDFSWHLEQASDIDIDAETAWAVCAGAESVIVAVQDDGVDRQHPDLPRVLEGADFTDQCESPPCVGQPQRPCDSHGTSIAGLGAEANNLGTAGVASGVTILPVRIGAYTTNSMPPSHCQPITTQKEVVDGVAFAISQGASVISLSWNYGFFLLADLDDVFQDAFDAGIVSVTSAGNNNEPRVTVPGMIPTVLAVSAIERDGNRHVRDSGAGSNYGPDVFVAAPGDEIITTDRVGTDGYTDIDLVNVSGTSLSAPIVAFTVGLIRSCRPDLSRDQVVFILRKTAVDLGAPGRDDIYGWGLVNAGGAVEMARDLVFGCDFESGDLSCWSQIVN